MERGEVDQPVGGQEEVGYERRNGVQFGDDDAAESDDEGEHVAAHRFVVLAVALGEEVQVGEEAVLAQRLEHFGRRDETGQRRAERRRETSRVILFKLISILFHLFVHSIHILFLFEMYLPVDRKPIPVP